MLSSPRYASQNRVCLIDIQFQKISPLIAVNGENGTNFRGHLSPSRSVILI